MTKQNWTNIELLSVGDAYFSELLESFRNAKSQIQVEMYILNVDSVTRTLLEELVRARERGVRVQILVDGFGSFVSIPTLEDFCRRHQIEFRVYVPMFLRNHAGRFWSYYLFNLLRLFRRLNRRDHRKMVIVDQKQAFVGSMNWTQVHSRKVNGPKAWRDTAVQVEGPGLEILVHSFRVSWYRANKQPFKRFRRKAALLKNYDPKKSMVRLNTSLHDRWRLHQDLLSRIRSARQRVLLTTAYFLPHRSLVRALQAAAARGIRVEIIVPGPSDVPIVKWAAFELAHNLTMAGIKIFEYQTSILHAKTVLIDQWATVGSTNLNYRSFLHDLEVEIVIDDTASLHWLERQWQIDIQNSRIFERGVYASASWLRRLASRLAFRLRYML